MVNKMNSWFSRVANATDEEKARWKSALERKMEEEKQKRAEMAPFHIVASNSNLTYQDYQTRRLENLEPIESNRKALEAIQKWDPSKKYGFFLCGNVGTGKTHLVKGLIMKWAMKGVHGEFWTLTDLMSKYKDSFGYVSDFKKSIVEPDIFVIDDFGAENTTDFVKTEFLSMIDMRINKGKAIFITSNASPAELSKAYGVRIMDRMRSLMVLIDCSGKSYRETISERNKKDAFR